MKRAYPQFLSAHGAALPDDLLRVIYPMDYWPLIKQYSSQHGLDPFLVAALINQESSFIPDARSRANAVGLMQVLPSTGRRLRAGPAPPLHRLVADAPRVQHPPRHGVLRRSVAAARGRPPRARELQRRRAPRVDLARRAAGARARRVHRRHPVPRDPELREEDPRLGRGLPGALQEPRGGEGEEVTTTIVAPAPVRRSRPLLGTLAVAVIVGLAAWVSLGVLTVTGTGPGAARIGLLPPWWVPIAAAVMALGVLWPGGRRGLSAWPLSILAITLVPWLPLPLSGALLMWAGPLTAWAWVAALAAWLVQRAPKPGASPATAFVLALAIFGGAAWQLREVRPGGDEPHYLVIVQSLLRDADLRIQNNHQRRDYAEYFGGVIRPHYLKRGTDREIYSIHAPGLPAIVAPAFALGGYPAVVALLVLLSALGTVLAWRATWLLTGDAGAAWFAWAASFAAPFFFHCVRGLPGRARIACSSRPACSRSSGSRRGAPCRRRVGPCTAPRSPSCPGCTRGSPPPPWCWAHASRCGLSRAGVRARPARLRARTLLAFLAVPAVGAAAWFGYFRAIWGTFSPAAPYGGYTQSSASNISARAAGPAARPAVRHPAERARLPVCVRGAVVARAAPAPARAGAVAAGRRLPGRRVRVSHVVGRLERSRSLCGAGGAHARRGGRCLLGRSGPGGPGSGSGAAGPQPADHRHDDACRARAADRQLARRLRTLARPRRAERRSAAGGAELLPRRPAARVRPGGRLAPGPGRRHPRAAPRRAAGRATARRRRAAAVGRGGPPAHRVGRQRGSDGGVADGGRERGVAAGGPDGTAAQRRSGRIADWRPVLP